MRVSVIPPGDLGKVELARWRAIQQADPAFDNPFLSPEFNRITVGELRDQGARRRALRRARHRGCFLSRSSAIRWLGKPVAAGLTDAQGLVPRQGPGDRPAPVDQTVRAGRSTSSITWSSGQPLDRPGAARAPLRRRSSTCVEGQRAPTPSSLRRHSRARRTRRPLAHKSRKLQRDVGPIRHDYRGTTDPAPLHHAARLEDRPIPAHGAYRPVRAAVDRRAGRAAAGHADLRGFAGVLDMITWNDLPDGRAFRAPHAVPRSRRLVPGLRHLTTPSDLPRPHPSPGDGRAGRTVSGIQGDRHGPGREGVQREAQERRVLRWPRAGSLTIGAALGRPLAAAGARAQKTRATVLANPLLHRTADRALKIYGRLRTTVQA